MYLHLNYYIIFQLNIMNVIKNFASLLTNLVEWLSISHYVEIWGISKRVSCVQVNAFKR